MTKAFFGLPDNVEFCRRCVISNQRPSSTVEFKHTSSERKATIGFEDGICDACRYHDIKEVSIDWQDRESRLLRVLEQHRSNDMRYDVIVPGSGGKDSAFTSHILKYKYGMNPLTVTWAPHRYTDIGWENFQNWIDVGGHDNILFTPNGRLHRHLTRLAFLNLLHPFQPFIIGQRIIGPLMAQKFGVKLVMYGENQAEYGNNPDDNQSPLMDQKFFSTKDPREIILGGASIGTLIDEGQYRMQDFAPYIPPDASALEQSGVKVHYLGFYLKWDPQECFYYASEHTGFKANTVRTEGTYSKYSSIDDKIDPFHYYTTLIKFGIGRASYDAAQEIRNGKITREEGVHLVHKYDQEFPQRYFNEFLDYVGVTEPQFVEAIDRFRSPHLWEHRGNLWLLKHQVS